MSGLSISIAFSRTDFVAGHRWLIAALGLLFLQLFHRSVIRGIS